MTRLLKLICLLFVTSPTVAQPAKFDSVAISIIDRMSDVIGDMRSCSFKLTTTLDIEDKTLGMLKHFTVYDVVLNGSNKMLINAQGYKGHRQFKYNGKQLTWYSFDENNYGTIPAPPTTIRTIDSLSATYGIEFPAADFFYPALSDDLMQNSESISLVSTDMLDGRQYYHILASGKETDIQIWVANDEWSLPSKLVVRYKTLTGSPQYYASFSEWSVNPDIPQMLFEFTPPPGAAKVKIKPRSGR